MVIGRLDDILLLLEGNSRAIGVIVLCMASGTQDLDSLASVG